MGMSEIRILLMKSEVSDMLPIFKHWASWELRQLSAQVATME